MKVIDTHTHLPGHAFDGTPRSAADLRKEFSGEGLSGAWLMTTDGLLGEVSANNDLLAKSAAAELDFFVTFCTVSPNDGADQAVAELVRARETLGMRGLKLHPWVQAFSLTNSAVLPIMKKAGALGMPVLFHDGTPPYATPLQIAAVAEKVPETTVILGHAGLDDLYTDSILACQRHSNVYLCFCSVSSGHIRTAINECPEERLLFGSDGGFGSLVVQNAITKVRATGVPETVLGKILFENPQRLLTLP